MTEHRTPNPISCPQCGRKALNLGTHVRFGGCGVTPEQLFWQKVDKSGECWIWLGAKERHGYGHFRVKGKDRRAHQYAWELANGKPWPAGMHAMHSCDVMPCVNPAHIRPGTQAENMADCKAKGRSTHGIKNHSAILTPEEVREIRAIYWCKGKQSNLDELHAKYWLFRRDAWLEKVRRADSGGDHG